jgi:hypothetical protein
MVALLVGATLVIGVGIAGASSGNIPARQHFANFGPFCIAKGPHAGQPGGVMRAVATGQKCFKWEKRIAHKRIPVGPAVNGSSGANGATGATGAQGSQGPAGATGSSGATGPAGVAGKNGVDGKNGTNGVAGKGATGARVPPA